MQNIIALDLEGVLIPEIWQRVFQITQIKELALTTRDMADYNALMTLRIDTLKKNNITIHIIADIIATVDPMPGSLEFLNSLRSQAEVIILSDTFVEFFQSFRKKLNYPTILCNSLNIDESTGFIQSYIPRMQDRKTHAVTSFQALNCNVIASGDSYNDSGMLKAADYGVWFRPPEQITKEYPDIPVTHNYDDLYKEIVSHLA